MNPLILIGKKITSSVVKDYLVLEVVGLIPTTNLMVPL